MTWIEKGLAQSTWIGSKTLHCSLFHAINACFWRWVSEELFGLAGGGG